MRYVCEICGYETERNEATWAQEQLTYSCPMCGGDGDLFYPEKDEKKD